VSQGTQLVSSPTLAFTVHGTPAPAGSKKAVPMGKRWGVIDDSKKSRPWKNLVAQHAGDAMAGRELLQGPLHLVLRFYVRRPKAHFGASGAIRPAAPRWPAQKPDATKLLRAVEDAMQGVVYRNDSQVVAQFVTKEWGPERVEVEVREL